MNEAERGGVGGESGGRGPMRGGAGGQTDEREPERGDAGDPPPLAFVSGAQGYVGGGVVRALQAQHWRVTELTRRPRADAACLPFCLGDAVDPARLEGARALVHCAYDFRQLSRSDIQRVNVEGSARLLRAAHEARIPHLVYVSSISAFDGCRSLYGQAKRDVERLALSLGAVVVRPGLVFGTPAGAAFARLGRQVARGIVPLPGDGRQQQHLVHHPDLTEFLVRCAAGEIDASLGPITVAHEQPHSLRHIVTEIARASGRTIRVVPIPWRLGWALARVGERLLGPLEFRSDSLVALMYQNPRPDFGPLRALGLACRPFSLCDV